MQRSFLDLSTAHLSISTRNWLDAQGVIAAAVRKTGDTIPVVSLGSTAFGWFVYADEISKLALARGRTLLNQRHEHNNGFGMNPRMDGLRRDAIQRIDKELAELVGKPDGIPADLHACMVRARWEDCEYILFDADAEVLDGLPTYQDGTDSKEIAA